MIRAAHRLLQRMLKAWAQPVGTRPIAGVGSGLRHPHEWELAFQRAAVQNGPTKQGNRNRSKGRFPIHKTMLTIAALTLAFSAAHAGDAPSRNSEGQTPKGSMPAQPAQGFPVGTYDERGLLKGDDDRAITETGGQGNKDRKP